MAETEYKRLIRAAQERATFAFLAVVQRAMQDADKHIADVLTEARSGLDRSALLSVRHFLRQDGNVFLRRIDALFRTGLDRAMQTMYIDMRPGMRQVSADELSLVGDEVMTHQIEVGRLAQRMRDANEESIGRLNVIIAQLHGQHEARERENPFRPYLIARALYDAIKETAVDESKAKVLFSHLSNTLTQHLPGYFGAIREVFESSGVSGKFKAQRSRAVHNQRYFGAPMDGIPAHLGARLMPGLQRVLENLQSLPPGGAGQGGGGARPADEAGRPESVQDFIRTMFSPAKPFVPAPSVGGKLRARDDTPGAPANPLVTQLDAFQKQAASGTADAPPLRERIALGHASMMERMTVDVVSMLFEFILEDDQVPAALRRHIGRLQVPILKAAVLDPGLMHDEDHPARQLLNRLGTAAVAADPESAAGKKLAGEIERVVGRVLADFDADMSVFSETLREFEQFLAAHLRQDDGQTSLAIEAIEEAERYSVLLNIASASLCDILVPLNVDKRISDVLIMVWPHVLVQTVWQDRLSGIAPDDPRSQYRKFHAAVPELLWSVQEKSQQQRAALMRLLPDLVRRLRTALEMIRLPEEDTRRILDLLVEMHTRVLRAPATTADGQEASLEEMQRAFSRLVVHWDRASWMLPDPPSPREDIIHDRLARKGVTADLHLGLQSIASPAADREFLAQTYLLGTRVAFRAADGSNVGGQLVWISTHRSLYLFRQERRSTLAVYTPTALLEGLGNESIVPVEYAPVFERAVESLLFGAGSLQSGAAAST